MKFDSKYEIERLCNLIHELEEQVCDLTDRCVHLEDEMRDINNCLDETKDLANDAFGEAESAQDCAGIFRDELQDTIDNLETKVNTIESDLSDAILTDSLN